MLVIEKNKRYTFSSLFFDEWVVEGMMKYNKTLNT